MLASVQDTLHLWMHNQTRLPQSHCTTTYQLAFGQYDNRSGIVVVTDENS